MSASTSVELLELAAEVLDLCALEAARAARAPEGTPECVGCGCVRFLGDGRCALCGGHA